MNGLRTMKNPIPDEALDDRLAFIGTSGSGKSYNAGGAVERNDPPHAQGSDRSRYFGWCR
jgi:ABC-type dipeptide/oligopeptide/nickel transport system ATPase component